MSTTGTKRLLGLAVVGFALLSLPVYGDTITDTNVQFTAFVTSTTVTLQIQCLSASCSSWFLGDVTLKGFTFTGATPGTAPTGYTLQNGGQNNSGGCNGTQAGKALCWDTSAPLIFQLGTNVIAFSANIIGGVVNGPLHVQAIAYNNSAETQQQGGKVLAVSDDLTGGTVPEPASMLLFGTGLGIVALLASRMLRKQRISADPWEQRRR